MAVITVKVRCNGRFESVTVSFDDELALEDAGQVPENRRPRHPTGVWLRALQPPQSTLERLLIECFDPNTGRWKGPNGDA